MRSSLPRSIAAAAVALLAAAGCRAAVDRAFQRPTVTFSGATLRGVGPNGGTVDVIAVVHNANPYPLRATRVRYRLLTADSAEVGSGEATDSLSVGARDSATLVLPVMVPIDVRGRARLAPRGSASAAGALGGVLGGVLGGIIGRR